MNPEKESGPPAERGAASDGRLSEIRREIDSIDRELLDLLNKRAALSLEVGRIKAEDQDSVFKPARERELLDKLTSQNKGPLPKDHLLAIWREILSSSRALQRPQRVAYLGPEGTFSYFAGLEYLGRAASFQPCRDISRIFEEVSNRRCELGVIPLENSLQGTVGASFDLFMKHDARIEAELYSRISHCLLSNAARMEDIKKIYSHPQPLAQCQRWLKANAPEADLIPAESTAAAAAMASLDPASAAVGNGKLASPNNLRILARHIEDEPGNWTRFVIISPPGAPAKAGKRAPADKTSLLFTLPDKPGSLAAVLDLMARGGVNMRKLESRPLRGQPWRYVFFCDVESDLKAPEHEGLPDKLAQLCTSFRILGSYPSGPRLEHFSGSFESEKENENDR